MQYFPCISLALFLAVLPLYFVRCIPGLIFRTLFPWLCEVLALRMCFYECASNLILVGKT